jgi:hypothetical protein
MFSTRAISNDCWSLAILIKDGIDFIFNELIALNLLSPEMISNNLKPIFLTVMG